MSGFSSEWLALREPSDHRARDAMLAMALADRLQSQPSIRVIDLGSGTGSNLRATYAALGPQQHWTLVDHDTTLLAAARATLTAWADSASTDGARLMLQKSGKTLAVSFRHADLMADLDGGLGDSCDLVTAAAVFDLCSTQFIDRFARAVAARRAVFYTVLTYNGIQRWMPRHDHDAIMLEAFHAHQATDKGFGLSAGPAAPRALAAAFRAENYAVQEADSPWLLARSDQPLVDALAAGFAAAVRETGAVSADKIDQWCAIARHGCEVGHTDTLALPPA